MMEAATGNKPTNDPVVRQEQEQIPKQIHASAIRVAQQNP